MLIVCLLAVFRFSHLLLVALTEVLTPSAANDCWVAPALRFRPPGLTRWCRDSGATAALGHADPTFLSRSGRLDPEDYVWRGGCATMSTIRARNTIEFKVLSFPGSFNARVVHERPYDGAFSVYRTSRSSFAQQIYPVSHP